MKYPFLKNFVNDITFICIFRGFYMQTSAKKVYPLQRLLVQEEDAGDDEQDTGEFQRSEIFTIPLRLAYK